MPVVGGVSSRRICTMSESSVQQTCFNQDLYQSRPLLSFPFLFFLSLSFVLTHLSVYIEATHTHECTAAQRIPKQA